MRSNYALWKIALYTPLGSAKIHTDRQRNYTEEQREAARERMKRINKTVKANE
ncbi:MAG: hypothetical protein LUD77_07190 [Clostridiales bacterium]|nr:hypothetical protein [Clostridiales bacterium]